MSTPRKPFQADIERALRMLHGTGSTFEVRAPKSANMGTASGYYTDHAVAARDIAHILDGKSPGVYVTLNPVKSDLLARAANRIKVRAQVTSQDSDITRRCWLPLDFDAQRPAGISSTDDEHEAALYRARGIAAFLEGMGWPDPVLADSGNGAHLLYRVDLPNDADSTELVNRTLKALASFVDDADGNPIRVCLDTSVGNPARIWKVYGTLVAKGDSMPDRPHRRAALLAVPESPRIVTCEQLEELCAALDMPRGAPPQRVGHGSTHLRSHHIEDFGAYLTEHGISYKDRGQHPTTGARRYLLEACVWSGHTDHSAWALQFTGGSIAVGCSHNSCHGKGLREFRDAVEPGWLIEPQIMQASRAEGNQHERNERNEQSTEHPPGDTSFNSFVSYSYPALDGAAYYGLAGEIVRAIEPHTESDPVALLVQLLVATGNVFGRHAYFQVEADRHYPNLFAVVVGASSKGRKGTSWSQVRRIFEGVVDDWLADHIAGGLSSGEGLIHALRDHSEDEEATALQRDKRLLAKEGEFAAVLKVLTRDGNTLSAMLRQAWDGETLRVLTKNSPERASQTHISVIGHITRDELVRYLSVTDAANGFGNRFLWVCAKRARLLAFGGDLRDEVLAPLRKRLREVLIFVKTLDNRRIAWSPDAAQVWEEEYKRLSEGAPGLIGSLTARAEPQVIRIAMIHALLKRSIVIEPEHLRAAVALWNYADQSARHIFGDALGDPTADTILQALRNSAAGLTRTEISGIFSRNKATDEIERSLSALQKQHLAECEPEETGGRPSQRWHAVRTPHALGRTKRTNEGKVA